MSKPHVWVVEEKHNKDWECFYIALDRPDAVEQRGVMRRMFGGGAQFRVAKYVRVEPTAKRRKGK